MPAPDVKFALAQVAMPTSVTTVPFTVTGLGANSRGGVAWGTSALSNNSPSNNARFSIGGGVSNSNRSVCMNWLGNSITTAIDGHRGRSDGMFGLQSAAASVGGNMDFHSLITNGVQGDVDDDYTAALINMLILSGADAQQGHITITETHTEGSYTEVELPFRPTCGIIRTTNDDLLNQAHQGYCSHSVGFFIVQPDNTIRIVSRAGAWIHANSGTSANYGYVCSNGFVTIDPTQVNNNFDGFFTGTLIGNTTFRWNTVNRTNDADEGVFCFDLFDTSNLAVQCGVLTLPASTGVQVLSSAFSPALTFEPQMLALALSTITSVDSFTGDSAEAGTMGFGAVTRPNGVAAGNVEYNSTVSCERGVTTSNSQSQTANTLFDIPTSTGATGTTGAFSAFGLGTTTVNLTASPAALKIPFLSVESETGFLARSSAARRNLLMNSHL